MPNVISDSSGQQWQIGFVEYTGNTTYELTAISGSGAPTSLLVQDTSTSTIYAVSVVVSSGVPRLSLTASSGTPTTISNSALSGNVYNLEITNKVFVVVLVTGATSLARVTQAVLLVSAQTASNARVSQAVLLISVPIPTYDVGIAYPLTPPTQLGPQEAKLRLMSVVGETASPFTGNQQEQQWPAQWFELEVTLPPMKRAANLAQRADKRYTAELWASFLSALGGRFGTFLIGDPNGQKPQGVAMGTPVTTGVSAVAPNNLITTTGWTPNTNGILLAGDYIQLTPTGAPQRLYKNLFDVNSDASGNATLTVGPMLHEAIPTAIPIVTNNPAGTFRLDENQAEWDIDRARTYGIKFKAKEAF